MKGNIIKIRADLNENLKNLQKNNQKQSQYIEHVFKQVEHIKHLYSNLNSNQEIIKSNPMLQEQMTHSTMTRIFKYIDFQSLLRVRFVSANFNYWFLCILPFILQRIQAKLHKNENLIKEIQLQINLQKDNVNQYEHIRQKVTQALGNLNENDGNLIKRTINPNAQIIQIVQTALCLIDDKVYTGWSEMLVNMDENFIWSLAIWNINNLKKYQYNILLRLSEIDEQKLFKKSEKVYRVYVFLKHMFEYVGITHIPKQLELDELEQENMIHRKTMNVLEKFIVVVQS